MNDTDPSVIDRVKALEGSRVRVTWPNGFQKSGPVRTTPFYAVLGDGMVGGEYCDAIRIEQMGEGGRYAVVWESTALRSERKRVVRHFQRYTSDERADLAASHRTGHLQRHAVGEYFYTHPNVPGIAFGTRQAAALAGMRGPAHRQQLDTLAGVTD